jgi:hypothetical protein
MLIIALMFVCAIIYYINFRRMRKPLYDVSEILPSVGDLPVIGHTHWFIGGPESEILSYDFATHYLYIKTDLET